MFTIETNLENNLIDAVVNFGKGKAYFFKGDKYISYDIHTDKTDKGYPRTIKDNWPGLATFSDGIDAAVNWGNGKAYFFKGDKYICYSITDDKACIGYPLPIKGNWSGLDAFSDGIDAVVNWGNGKAYFFKGDKYIRYDIGKDKADHVSPLPIKGNWPGLDAFSDGIDAVVNWGNRSDYFFKGDKYIRYDFEKDRAYPGYPLLISENWNDVNRKGKQTLSIVDEDELKEQWKKLANYDNMGIGDSVFLTFLGDEKYAVASGPVTDVLNAKSGVIVTRNFTGPQFSLVAKASLMNIHAGSKKIDSVDFDILSASAQAEASSTYIGAGATLELVGGSVSVFDAKLALSADTGVGIKDDSFKLEVVGTGFTVGRKVGISVLGSEISIDFAPIFNLF